MAHSRTPIIPAGNLYYGPTEIIDERAICIFSALGFFLETDTYWTERKALPVASDCIADPATGVIEAKPYFRWSYHPRESSFDDTVDEFSELFEDILKEQTDGRRVILPLSGGLDSRTQSAGLKRIGADVSAYSYSFRGGHDETIYAKEMAKIQGFPFHAWTVEAGYLWKVIDDLAEINACYSEFTHPRQMAFLDRYAELGEVFSLGHWGDVLFDDMGVPDDLSFDQQVRVVMNKVVKKGGRELGNALWKAWGFAGDFDEYLRERIESLLRAIDIPNSANAQIRAFKSMYWAPRWTSVNLSVFERARPITLPYYDNRMCEFICTIPERFLAGRQIQIGYLKRRAPKLARIPWQDHRPFNLFSYKWDRLPWNSPYRLYDKVKRMTSPRSLVQRNWELQFTGESNDQNLREYLFGSSAFASWIPTDLVQDFYHKFRHEDAVRYSHSISMLLTLCLFKTREATITQPYEVNRVSPFDGNLAPLPCS